MTLTVSEIASRDHAQAAACRKLWATVLLHDFNNYWRRSAKKGADLTEIRADALRYFRSFDGRWVALLAGVTADPERLADVAIDPTAKGRTLWNYAETPDQP